MLVHLVRHAIAVDRETSDDDFSRRLTPKGRKQFKALAEWLVGHGQIPDVIVTSPLVRAVQTAEILAKAAGIGKKDVRIESAAGPDHDALQLLNFLSGLDAKSVAVVGHEPSISHTAAEFIGGGRLTFFKGSVACIAFEGSVGLGAGELEWLMHPKMVW